MWQWLLQNAALYVAIVAMSFRGRRAIATIPRLTAAAWLVVAIKYVPWIWGMGLDIWRGACGFRCATQWAALMPWITLVLVPTACVCLWQGREALASLLLLVVAGNWILFELIAVEMECIRMALWLCAVPLLGAVTLITLGGYASWKSLKVQTEAI